MVIQNRTPLTVKQAAEFTGYTKAYLYKLIHLKKIPYYKPDTGRPGKVFFCKEELQDFIFANRFSTNAELQETADTVLNAGGAK